jgi:hypothetical protein
MRRPKESFLHEQQLNGVLP